MTEPGKIGGTDQEATVDTARNVILARVRSALGPDPTVPPIVREHRTSGEHIPGSASLVELLEDRLLDYRAGVCRTTPDELSATVAALLDRVVPARGVVVPADLPAAWTAGREVVRDHGATTTEMLDRVAAVVTGCSVAIAETGTIVLDAGPEQGRRALTLVPDVHVCVVRLDQIVQTVPEAVRRLDACRPQTWISGPSATSDIELERVEGVHGPRTLEVVLVVP